MPPLPHACDLLQAPCEMARPTPSGGTCDWGGRTDASSAGCLRPSARLSPLSSESAPFQSRLSSSTSSQRGTAPSPSSWEWYRACRALRPSQAPSGSVAATLPVLSRPSPAISRPAPVPSWWHSSPIGHLVGSHPSPPSVDLAVFEARTARPHQCVSPAALCLNGHRPHAPCLCSAQRGRSGGSLLSCPRSSHSSMASSAPLGAVRLLTHSPPSQNADSSGLSLVVQSLLNQIPPSQRRPRRPPSPPNVSRIPVCVCSTCHPSPPLDPSLRLSATKPKYGQ